MSRKPLVKKKMAMADDEGDSKSVEPRPLPHQQEREQEQEQQTEDPLSSTPLILPPPPSAVPPPPSADTSLVTPDVFTGEQDEKNTNRNNGFASANADPSSDNVDPSTVAANAACLDSPKLLHDVSNKEIYRVPDYSGTGFFLLLLQSFCSNFVEFTWYLQCVCKKIKKEACLICEFV